MYTVRLNEENDRLAQLIKKVVRSEEVVILCDDGSSFELLLATSNQHKPEFGSAKALIAMSDDFDEPLF